MQGEGRISLAQASNSVFLSPTDWEGVCVVANESTNNLVVGCDGEVALKAENAINNLVAHSTGAGLLARSSARGNLLYDNAGGDFDTYDYEGVYGNVTGEDPLFRDFTDDGDWSNDDLRVEEGSPAIDAGVSDCPDQDLNGVARPQDGDDDGLALCDIGPYEWGLIDQDGDGWYVEDDCDDEDPDINPAAEDIPYNGIDEDCDGSDLTDADGDGHDAEHQGGDDCDDTDEDIHPDAWDIPDNGIDEDCDGEDATDADGDGWPDDQDCDNEDADIHPTADETCDGVDNDCDDEVDEGCDDTADTGTTPLDDVDTAGEVPGGCCEPNGSDASLWLIPLVLMGWSRRRLEGLEESSSWLVQAVGERARGEIDR